MNPTRNSSIRGAALLAVLLLAGPAGAQEAATGGVPGEWYNSYTTARTLGLGGAFVALADDPMGVIWNPAEEPGAVAATGPTRRLGGPPLMVIPAVLLVVCSLAIAVAAGPLFSLSERTATDLLHPSQYVDEVLGR